jgi:hypothetical protein
VTTLFFVAEPGEINDVSVSRQGAEYRFEDRGAPLTAGSACRQTTDIHVVLCDRPTRGQDFVALLDDQNDTIRHSVQGHTFGGSGDDTAIGSRFVDIAEGGTGDDVIDGGAGSDGIDGDDGNDALTGGLGHDALAGGPGSDVLNGGADNDSFFPNDFIRFATFDGGEPGQGRTSDRLGGGRGLDVAVYRFDNRRAAPTLNVTLNGRADDGPRHDSDNFGRDVERAYTFAPGRQCGPGGRICRLGSFRVLDEPGPNGERIQPIGAFSLRIYRLSARAAPAKSALFEALNAGPVGVSEGRSRLSPSELSFPKGRLPGCSRGATASGLSRAAVRRMRARANGRYRTRSPNSAATVRGTDWTMIQRCDGTLTRVRRGTVVVRDFRLRRTILVHAGESYLARAAR